jgi:hypothetical protein
MFLGTSRGPGGVAADGEADALHCWSGFELFSRAEWIITAANETGEMPAGVVQEAPIAVGREARGRDRRLIVLCGRMPRCCDRRP